MLQNAVSRISMVLLKNIVLMEGTVLYYRSLAAFGGCDTVASAPLCKFGLVLRFGFPADKTGAGVDTLLDNPLRRSTTVVGAVLSDLPPFRRAVDDLAAPFFPTPFPLSQVIRLGKFTRLGPFLLNH